MNGMTVLLDELSMLAQSWLETEDRIRNDAKYITDIECQALAQLQASAYRECAEELGKKIAEYRSRV